MKDIQISTQDLVASPVCHPDSKAALFSPTTELSNPTSSNAGRKKYFQSDDDVNVGEKRSAQTKSDAYWNRYLAARPTYDASSFYDKLFAYHREQGNGQFDCAHDVACGPGNVASVLARHFKHVVASDVNSLHVDTARTRLASSGIENVSFAESLSEDVGHHAAPASADLIACAEAMPLMDLPKSLEVFSQVLKPRGTLAMWFYGRPHFVKDDGSGELDEVINDAYAALSDHTFASATRMAKRAVNWPTVQVHNWFDNIAMPPEQWASVKRHKWNFDCEMAFAGPEAVGQASFEPVDKVIGVHEECTDEIDRTFWSEQWTAAKARRFVMVNLPIFNPVRLAGDQQFALLFENLERVMGGKDVRHQVTWPVVLILATRK